MPDNWWTRMLSGGKGWLTFLISGYTIGMLAADCPAQRNTRLYMFDAARSLVYSVAVNGVPTTVLSSPAGVVGYGGTLAVGDVVAVTPDPDSNTQPPSPPLVLDAGQEGAGCCRVSWLQVGDPAVVGYRIVYGASPVTGGGVYDYAVSTGNVGTYVVCGLATGTWYFAVQARNAAGQLSAYSSELSVDITPTAVLITAFDAAVQDGVVLLTWEVFADEDVAGFRVYRAAGGHGEPPGPDRLIVDERVLDGASRTAVDATVEPGIDYRYTLAAVRPDGSEAALATAPAGVPGYGVELFQNRPNPFNPSTSIVFTLGAATNVRLEVFDVRGRAVAVLDDAVRPAGRHTVRWDGRDRYGEPVASGVYYYRLRAGTATHQRKMLLLK